ncbi:P-loop containing nucleoside triphosphate hydrolase protein [Aaosphaeria arxii CBS 175.79]|uniref:P-loop containing nucleoside triphosphate hydrolase protein n=1 Tax=Aaosphaeria arxii CBS 175.79 TaxID=1450172 RepID=A0A6A5XTG1_9PLEO|nr:P-loop containing nucleoside triphosphate hydrolase protein [Aaosphaeria arxii CBS 175.79]KAF2016635.1 P-loop containing nucleoside triphosphate hydrolase protein [Aaosphaeria arxii CBS 175.79]
MRLWVAVFFQATSLRSLVRVIKKLTATSGAGKTQLLLTLLLASQLPPPYGLSKSAIYISTEAALATNRLSQLLSTHPKLKSLPAHEKPSLSRILSIQTPDLETQEHILRYQLPVAIKKHRVGLVIFDSVAANYRAEFEKQGARDGAASMAKRGTQLVRLGALFRDLARTEGVAVVVANQVADRFFKDSGYTSNAASRTTSTNSQGTTSGRASPMPGHFAASQTGGDVTPMGAQVLSLDHQQRWTTGWGEDRFALPHTLKTPSLGHVWTNQIACRIALIKQPVMATRPPVLMMADGEAYDNEEENHIAKWRRWFKVVFAPWTPPTDEKGIEYEILTSGLRHVSEEDS